MSVTVKRQFAVILEDAFEVEAPTPEALAEHDGDLQAWAIANLDDFYARANDGDDLTVTLQWEDKFKFDVDSIDDEIIVEESA